MIKHLKKIISFLVSITIIAISTHAAVVSDNDGSAFITKAEFDSLKNNFQSQIDSYNMNIDNKIDAAIAGYLAGITTDTEKELVSMIDSNGVYGNKMKMSWSSATNYRMISADVPRAIENWTQFNCTYKIKQYTTEDKPRPIESEIDTYDGIWNTGNLDYNGNPVSNYDAGTKKEYRVETVKINTTDYRMLRFVKVVNYIESNQFCGFPTNYDEPTGGGTAGWWLDNMLTLNIDNCTQENLEKGLLTDYYRPTNFNPDYTPYIEVIKTGNTMITQNYEEDFEHVFAPFSTIQEYVWDPKSRVPLNFNGNMGLPGGPIPLTARGYWAGDSNPRHYQDPRQGTPHICRDLYFAWQHLPFKSGVRNESGDNVQAKDSIIYNYWAIDDRNWMQKNGLVLGTVPSGDEVEVVCQCCSDVPGTVYFWCGPKYTVIDNWTSSSFGGISYALTGSNKEEKISLGKVNGDYTIWVLFAPTNTATTGKFKVNRLFYKVTND